MKWRKLITHQWRFGIQKITITDCEFCLAFMSEVGHTKKLPGDFIEFRGLTVCSRCARKLGIE